MRRVSGDVCAVEPIDGDGSIRRGERDALLTFGASEQVSEREREGEHLRNRRERTSILLRFDFIRAVKVARVTDTRIMAM